MNKKVIGLIYGGKSSEHEVSLRSAFSLINAINYNEYQIVPFFVDLKGDWNRGDKITSPLENFDILREYNDTKINPFELKNEIDVFFPVVHGPYGEDGSLQGFLEILNVPYVGCGVLASSTGMDKIAMKDMFNSAGIPQCKYEYFERNEFEKNSSKILTKIEKKLGYPCFVKPANLGSSVGINKANNRNELHQAIVFASKFDRRIIVEENVDAREVEIGVLGNNFILTSEIGEVVSNGQFYDYKSKYKDDKTEIKIPAEIPLDVKEKISDFSKVAFKCLDGSGISRIDFFYDEKNNSVLLNEINTMPGFTNFSMYPMLFEKVGIGYSELINRLIILAEDKFSDKNKNQIEAEDFDKSSQKK